ncbi:MAG: prepilin-type N-terminal cleavage/methylation domain-containing protein [Planctomycetota bacterium]|nr:prepilin-type N-terminal cleavage/methylation domain-containing protein [Planctomycetota bacterium]
MLSRSFFQLACRSTGPRVPARAGRLAPRRAFTLVEILIVVVILGVIAAIVVPSFAQAVEQAENTAFIAELKTMGAAAERFYAQTGTFLEDASTGVLPAGFGAYIDASRYVQPTPLGGRWDTEQDSFGITSAIGVHFNSGARPASGVMASIDAQFDDGDLNTGQFRRIGADRFYYIVAD